MDSSNFKVVCDHCDAKLASVFCHSDGAFLCAQCDAQVHSVNKLAQRHLRVPCQSCPVWAYREAKSRGRLLDMPLVACLTRNLQLDVFDGTAPCWPSINASSVAMGTPQSDASSPQATTTACAPANLGSPNSEVHATALPQVSNSWPQKSALAIIASHPQAMPQPSLGCASMSQQGVEKAEALRTAAPFSLSPFSTCSGGSIQTAAQQPQSVPERCSVQASNSTAAALQQQHLPQAAQSQHSQHTLQRATSQELMDAVDSMDVALLLDTFGAPMDVSQDNNKTTEDAVQQPQVPQQPQEQVQQQHFQIATDPQSQAGALCFTSMPSAAATAAATAALENPLSLSWPPLARQAQQQQQALLLQQQLQQQQQRQVQMNAAAFAAVAAGCLIPTNAFSAPPISSEPVAVPYQRQQQPAVRSLSGLSCLSQSGLSSSNTDGQQLGSARGSNTMLLQSLEQQMNGAATCALPMTLAGVGAASGGAATAAAAVAGWSSIEASQLQLQQLQQQLQQQQQAALQYIQQEQQQQQVAAALAAAQKQQQQQAMQQLLQRAMTDDLPRTSPISIGNTTATTLAAAAVRRDANMRTSLGLSDPGMGADRSRTLAQSPLAPPASGTAFASARCSLLDNLSGFGVDPSSIAAAAATSAGGAARNPLVAAAAAGLLTGVLSASAAGQTSAAAAALPPLAGARSLDAAASSFGALPTAVVGSGGSTSVSPMNCNTLAGAVSERHAPLTAQQLAQQMVLPGSAPPALGLAASANMVSSCGGSCELSEAQLMRLSSDGFDGVIAAAATASTLGGSIGMLGLDAEMAGLLMRIERPDGTFKELDPERAAQLTRYKQKRMLRMRALAEGAKKVRYECRKQLADSRPRVRGRFAKVNSSDALMDFGSGLDAAGGVLPASSSANTVAATSSACNAALAATNPGPLPSNGGGWGLHGHHQHTGSQPHMQRIDEEGTCEGQSSFMTQPAYSVPLREMSSLDPEMAGTYKGATSGAGEGRAAATEAAAGRATAAAPAIEASGGLDTFCGLGSFLFPEQSRSQQQQPQQDGSQEVHCGKGGGGILADGERTTGSLPAKLLGSCLNANPINTSNATGAATVATVAAASSEAGGVAAAASQDCVMTEHVLVGLGFDDLPLSGGFSNAGNSNNEDMDESAESMNDGASAQPGPVGTQPCANLPAQQQHAGTQPSGTRLPLGATAAAAEPQQQEQRQLPQPHPAQVGDAATAACLLQPRILPQAPAQPQAQMRGAQPRLSVLDRPIMYGTDLSQFSAAQLSLLDSILTDQYRPSGPGVRH